jgi:hypothetical protein
MEMMTSRRQNDAAASQRTGVFGRFIPDFGRRQGRRHIHCGRRAHDPPSASSSIENGG